MQSHCWIMPICSVIAVVAGCTRPEHPTAETGKTHAAPSASAAVPRVAPIHPERKTLIRRTEQPGEIQAFEETPLHAKVSGYVESVSVDIGDHVRGPRHAEDGKLVQEGQLLVKLSIPELDEELNQKRALVSQAEAEIDQALAAVKVAQAERNSAEAKVAEARAAQEKDQALVHRWKSEYQRVSELAASKAVSRKVAEETENQLRAAESARSEAAAKIRSAEAQFAETDALIEKAQADVAAARAKARVAEAERQRLEALCSFALIRAPFDGVITVRNIHKGHLVRSATAAERTPLLVVVRTDIVRIFVDIPEADAVLVQNDSEAQIRIPSLSSAVFSARVTRTAWVLNTGTRTLRTELDVENASGQLRPGMFANSDIKLAERQNALVLPKSAIVQQGATTVCCCVNAENKIARKPIKIGIQSGNEVEIVSGLEGNENVIGANAAAFQEGQLVEIIVPPTDKK